jgi:hypothetical protein
VAAILLVVADKAALTAGDTFVRDRLLSKGHTIILRSDEEAEITTGYDGIFAADSCSAGTLSPKYGTVAKPAITSEFPTGWGLGTLGTGGSSTNWTVEAGTALSAGLSGTQTVYPAAITGDGSTQTSIGAGTVVARQGAGTVCPVVYWDTGTAMAVGSPVAPARRALFRVVDPNIGGLLAPGLAVLDAAIAWAYPATAFAPLPPSRARRNRPLLVR